MKIFFMGIYIVIASGFSFAMDPSSQQNRIDAKVKLFKKNGDVFECSPDFRENSSFINNLYSALVQLIAQNELMDTSDVKFKFLKASHVDSVIKALTSNTRITRVGFQFCKIDADGIASLVAMLKVNRTLEGITFSSPSVSVGLVDKFQAIATQDNRLIIFAPNHEPLDHHTL